ncbi:hypothetical protein VDIAB_270115 [Vibrio diabolicus]|nr:hypothetical protein VDIAB_270115 [Vibrio diabolicus]
MGLIPRYSPSYVRKLGRESSEQVIKLLVRSFRRLRLIFLRFVNEAYRTSACTSDF